MSGSTSPALVVAAATAAAGAVAALVCSMRRKGGVKESWAAQAALIGNTPLVSLKSLNALCAPNCKILAKAEHLNPSGTGKDRIALAMLTDAESRGDLPKGGGGTVVEGSSGSTAIALAPLASAAGHRLIAVLPDDVSEEKLQQLAFVEEIQVVRASSISSPGHYVNVARRTASALRAAGKQAVCTDQFENGANWRAHYEGTGKEIWSQTGGRLSAFVMSAGTGGTIAGVSNFLKEKDPSIAVYLADPQGSSLASRVRYGVCYTDEQREQSVRRHRYDTVVDGVGLDRVTANFKNAIIDDALTVTDQDALIFAHYLHRFEGLFLGSSAALNCVAAVRAANEISKNRQHRAVRIVTILCDSGHRYFSRFWNRKNDSYHRCENSQHYIVAGKFIESRGLVWPPEDLHELRKVRDFCQYVSRHPFRLHTVSRGRTRTTALRSTSL